MSNIVIEEDTYQGKPVISLMWTDNDKYPFSFGVTKAKMLKAALKVDPDFLDRFIKEHSKK